MRVLIVEDDAAVCRIVSDQLQSRGIGTVTAGTVAASREALEREDFPTIVLDLSLPDGSGLDVLAELRASGSSAHVIVLTGAGSEADRVNAIESGADDYVVKPFFARELAARVLAVERRRGLAEDTSLRVGPLEIDLKAHEVTDDGRLIDLTTKEFALLAFLAARPGHTFSRAELLRAVWQSSADWQQSSTVTEHVRRLRIKIEADPRHPEMLKTVRGAGYRLDVPSPDPEDEADPDAAPRPSVSLHPIVTDVADDLSDAVIATASAGSLEGDDLRRGLDANELEVHYQPVVTLADGILHTVEALVRWQHPVRGLLRPDAFIESAERDGGIVELGTFVLNAASREVARWRAGGADIVLSMNVSAIELADSTLVDRIVASIEAAGLDSHALWLEVTETSLVRNLDQAAGMLRRLGDLGIGIAIDDFGTGWASLTYLSKFPIHALKIDRIFVAGVNDNPSDRAIVRSIVRLGTELGLAVIAEGIETVAQSETLQALGCLMGQGYLFGQPTPADAVPIQLAPRTVATADSPAVGVARPPRSPRITAPALSLSSSSTPTTPAFDHQDEEFFVLVAAGRPGPAIAQTLGLLDAGSSVEELIVGLLAPTQREVGLRWHANRWNTAQEHAASSVIDAVLGALASHIPVPSIPRGTVLVSCVEGDHHSLPARMGAERLRCDGWDVTFLGANVPADDLASFAAKTHADAVVLSCTSTLLLPAARRAISALAELGIPTVAAGAGFGVTPRRAARLGASGWIGPASNPTAVLTGLPATVGGAGRQREGEAVQFDLHANELHHAAMDEMCRRIPALSTYSSQQLARTEDDLTNVLRCLGSALDLDEPALFEDFVAWLSEFLTARGVPSGQLDSSLEIVAEVVRRAGFAQAAYFCTSARLVLVGD